ncbi:hypothetical protein [Flavobacterium daemonense]|uniref:hypothetical protein n=1 Tax=Flavobacterium daemonense TaxID=1393049 RepID=UPI0011854299|nr:hypothetical protein [Flavobacterium daemonense]KAF2333817.1 hypothetical protein FND99_10130 [Flavobacterium daemonense]
MRKYYLLLLIVILNSCSNNESELNDAQTQALLGGRWNWVQSTTQSNSTPITPAIVNKSRVLAFSGTSYKEYENGTLISNRTFFVVKKPSIYGGEKNMFVFKNAYSSTSKSSIFRATGESSFEIIGKKLYIREEFANGIIEEYDRVLEY